MRVKTWGHVGRVLELSTDAIVRERKARGCTMTRAWFENEQAVIDWWKALISARPPTPAPVPAEPAPIPAPVPAPRRQTTPNVALDHTKPLDLAGLRGEYPKTR